MAARLWLGLCASLVCQAALAGNLQQPTAPAPPASAPQQQADAARDLPPDDGFIEFLGADDVGDAAWWEFLKKSAPRKDPPSPAPTPQDAKS